MNFASLYDHVRNRRQGSRRPIELQARLYAAGKPMGIVMLRNISQAGCLLDCNGLTIEGKMLALELPGRDAPLGIRVVHSEGGYLGACFETALDEQWLARLIATHSTRRFPGF